MDHGSSHLIYFDTRASIEITVESTAADGVVPDHFKPPLTDGTSDELDIEVAQNTHALLSVCSKVHLFNCASSCLSELQSVESANPRAAIVVVIQTPLEDSPVPRHLQQSARSPSPLSSPATDNNENHDPNTLSGLSFLRHLSAEKKKGSFLTVTAVVMLSGPHDQGHDRHSHAIQQRGRPSSGPTPSQKETFCNSPYLEAGAADIFRSPLTADRVQCLPAHAHRTCQELLRRPSSSGSATPRRKSSWVGVNDSKPFAYLRESMVSGLMDRICDPDYVEKPVNPSDIEIPPERRAVIAKAVGTWEFSAHDFNDDELLYGAFLILQHTLSLPGLEKWRMSDDDLLSFLLACRRVYNSFVIYHNFRHACDVLQAAFFFLISIGAIPLYPPKPQAASGPDGVPSEGDGNLARNPNNGLAALVEPFHALTLVISAVGHDVGHPGVNNLFLVNLNAPLAQLYNDRSVLESFHCAAFSQILRRYWPAAFADVPLRRLMINAILATDMNNHHVYVGDLAKLNEAMSGGNSLDGLDEKKLEEHRVLLCCLLIKCADICNVGRKFPVATQWANILTDEFHNQGLMETELGMPSCLFGGPPVLDDIIRMGASQIGFMNIFGIPLFSAMSGILPSMQFAVDEIRANKAVWEQTIEKEKAKQQAQDATSKSTPDRNASPQNRRGSIAAQSQIRSDPMVFGSHSTPPPSAPSAFGPPSGRRTSGGHASYFTGTSHNYNASRRASLGPTVIPNPQSSTMSSRRSSGSHARSLGLGQQQHQSSPIAISGRHIPQLDGSAASTRSSRNEAHETLDENGELSHDEDAPVKAKSKHLGTPATHASVAKAQESTERIMDDSWLREAPPSPQIISSLNDQFDPRKRPLSSRVTPAVDRPPRESRSRSKSRRKFSIKFWRKSRSVDAASRESES